MGKTAFVFPGQGAQYIGMGKDFYDEYEEARKVFELADRCSGYELSKLVFEENEKLNITKYTQIAMLTVELAILKCVQAKGLKCDVSAGLSLGEYAALAASGAMELCDILKLITKRGIFMQEAYPQGGAMAAVLGLDSQIIEKICEAAEGDVSIANYNCPGQVVITGEEKAVLSASEKLKEAGARRCIALNVSGPFHSPLLHNAGERLAGELADITVYKPVVPYVCNTEARYVTEAESIKELLSRQVYSSVRFEQSIRLMIADGVDTFVEIGPGRTLSSFIRKTDKNVRVFNISTTEELDKAVEELSC